MEYQNSNLSNLTLLELTDKLSGNKDITKAKVILPSEDELKIELVSSTLVHRLEELREDEKIFQNYFYTILGAFLGLVLSMLIDEKLLIDTTKSDFIILGSLLFLTIFLGYLSSRSSKKTKALKNKIFPVK